MALRDDAALLILTSLAGGPKHGYAMIEDIATMSGVRLGPGTLYGAIGRLEAEAMIEALQSDDRSREFLNAGADQHDAVTVSRRHAEADQSKRANN